MDLAVLYKTHSIKFLNSDLENKIDFNFYKQMTRVTIEINDAKELFQFSVNY